MIPAETAGFPLKLVILKGQKDLGSQAFFHPVPFFWELNLTVCGTPLLELNHRSSYTLVQNLTNTLISVTARRPLGLLIDSSFHDFELTVPVIGELLLSLVGSQDFGQALLTFPDKMIFTGSHDMLQKEQVYTAKPDSHKDMVVYALAAHPSDTHSSPDTTDS